MSKEIFNEDKKKAIDQAISVHLRDPVKVLFQLHQLVKQRGEIAMAGEYEAVEYLNRRICELLGVVIPK